MKWYDTWDLWGKANERVRLNKTYLEPIMTEADTHNYSSCFFLYFCMWLKFSMIKFLNCVVCYYSKLMIQREISFTLSRSNDLSDMVSVFIVILFMASTYNMTPLTWAERKFILWPDRERASSPAYFQGRASPGSILQACQLATDCTVGCLHDLHPKWDILTAKPDGEMKWVVQHLCRDPTLCDPAWPLQPDEGSLLVPSLHQLCRVRWLPRPVSICLGSMSSPTQEACGSGKESLPRGKAVLPQRFHYFHVNM